MMGQQKRTINNNYQNSNKMNIMRQTVIVLAAMKRNYQNIRRIVLLLCVVLGGYVQTMAQPDPVITARAFYENGDYSHALNLYLQTNESKGDQLKVMYIGCKTQYLNIGDSKSYVVRLKKN